MDLRTLQEAHFRRAQENAIREAVAATGMSDVANVDWYSPNASLLRMREAVGHSGFPQLLRTGVQQFLFDGYQQPNVVYPDLVRVVNSTKRQELYAPLYQTELPEEVLPGQPFPESDIQGADQQLVNRKWGRMLSFERELVDDDQTGQIIDKASELGRRMRIREEMRTFDVLFGEYLADGTTSAWSTGYGDYGNRPSSYGPITEAALKAADTALEYMTDPLGNRMLVDPTMLLHASKDKFDVQVLLKSMHKAAVPSTTAGDTGALFSVNPLEGLYTPVHSRFVPTTGGDGSNPSWMLQEPKRGLVFQDRDPLESLSEGRDSGASFEYDAYRYRVRRRFEVGMIESRFCYRGN